MKITDLQPGDIAGLDLAGWERTHTDGSVTFKLFGGRVISELPATLELEDGCEYTLERVDRFKSTDKGVFFNAIYV